MKRLIYCALIFALNFSVVFDAQACSWKHNGDNTMTDPNSGTVWQVDVSGVGNWLDAMNKAKASRQLGKSDWRLPNDRELMDLMQSGCWNVRQGTTYLFSFETSAPNANIAYMDQKRIVKVHGMSDSKASFVFVRSETAVNNAFNREYSEHIEQPLLKKKIAQEREDRIQQEVEDKRRAYENSPAGRAEAREREQAATRQRAYENSPAGIAQRQGRQLCEAQKQTCKAGCGPITYWNGRSYVDNPNYSSCDYRCSQISCN